MARRSGEAAADSNSPTTRMVSSPMGLIEKPPFPADATVAEEEVSAEAKDVAAAFA